MGTLLNHTVANLAGGVSQQFDEGVFEVQVRELKNCIPSISRGILRRNPITDGTLLTTLSESDYFVYSYDRGTDIEQYTMLLGNGSWYVFNATTKALVSSGTDSYLTVPVGVSPKEAFSIVTIGDFTFVANKFIQVKMSATVDGVLNSHKTVGVYWVKKTSQVQTATKTIGATTDTQTSGSLMEGYKYGLNGQEVFATRDTRSGGSGADLLRGEQIAASLASKLAYSSYGPFVYKTGLVSTAQWTWYDSAGNEASYGFKGEVQRSDKLPDKMPSALIGTIVNITQGTGSELDDYWLKYTGDTWIETRKPGMQNTIASNTMPHVFIRGSDNLFYFTEYTSADVATVPGASANGWLTRTVGDEDSCPIPTFVNSYINQIFFHKNRLCIISKDSISLSENGEYGNFFNTTVRIIPDTDPIDLTIASTEVSLIHSAVSTNSALILFSDDVQFVLSSGQQPLTPVSANIEVVSRYNSSSKCKPRAIGNKIYFISESGGFSQLFMYNISEGYNITEANQVSQHIPSYLPKNIRYIVGHSVLGDVFMWSEETPKIVYCYKISVVGSQIAQSAFHKWEFPYDVIGINIINNNLSITLRNSLTNNYYIGNISLEISGTPELVNYADKLNGSYFNYDSQLEFSKWYIKDGNNNGTKAGRLQIRTIQYTNTKESAYTTYIVTDDGNISTDLGTWTDSGLWIDTETWTDTISFYTVAIDNNNKVQIMGNSDNTIITFAQDRFNPTKGFELQTVNYEGFFHQRSQRY